MFKYDVLRDTWIYQEIQQEVQAEVAHHYLTEQRQLLLEIVRARFPRLDSLATQLADTITEPALLRSLILKISTVRTEKEARQSFHDLAQT